MARAVVAPAAGMNALAWPLHFLRPWWWLALLPLPVVLWTMARSGGGRAMLARLADAALLPHLLQESGARRHAGLAWIALAWLVAVIALAGPAWQKVATPLYVNGAARVVALSLSDDMLAQDWQPDRLTHARFAVRDLLTAAGDARTALVAYAGAAFTVAPLTNDKRTVLNLLQALQPNVMPVPGNDAAAGIHRSVQLLEQAHVKGGDIVLVTDTASAAAVAAARAARARGIRVDVLGVGTSAGAPVPRTGGGFASDTHGLELARRDDAALRAVAAAGGGRYSVLRADGNGVAALGAPTAVAGRASADQRAQLWRDGGVWLLPLLAVLAALAFRRGWLLVLACVVLPLGVVQPAQAAAPGDWFANRDQRALRALAAGNVKRAQALATTPAMRGAADYRAGDYAAAGKAFAQGTDARARYNLGNALAQQGEYARAIGAYRQALQLDPHDADARANLAAVQAWMRQHPKSPAPSQSQSSAQRTQAGKGAQKPSSGSNAQPAQGAPSSGSPSASPGARSQSGASPQANPSGDAGHNGAQSLAPGAPARLGRSAGAKAPQPGDAQRATRALDHELRNAKPASPADSGVFALGRAPRDSASRLDARQRALLHAVPDDPGALLRRKFQLEWQQRNASKQENGQP